MKNTQLLYKLAALALCSGAISAAPKLLPFQGHLTQSNGTAVADGAKVVQFKIYDAPVSGTAVWAGEVHKLSVNKGLVNTILGTKTAFPARYGAGNAKVMFSEPLYVEITVDAQAVGQPGHGTITAADPPLLPRQVLLPANFAHVAMSAETVEGVDLVDENTNTLNPSVIGNGSIPGTAITSNSITAVQVAPSSIGTGEITDGSLTTDDIADGTVAETDLTPALNQRLNLGLIPPGTIVPFAGKSDKVPTGWLLCDGSALSSSSATYAALYAVIEQSWGNGTATDGTVVFPVVMSGSNQTDFNVPDLRGVFLRGVNGGITGTGNDPDKDSRVARRPGGNIGNLVGSYQSYEIQSHSHSYSLNHNTPLNFNHGTQPPRTTNTGGANGSTHSTGGAETRPKNVYVNYIIKY